MYSKNYSYFLFFQAPAPTHPVVKFEGNNDTRSRFINMVEYLDKLPRQIPPERRELWDDLCVTSTPPVAIIKDNTEGASIRIQDLLQKLYEKAIRIPSNAGKLISTILYNVNYMN